MGFPELRFFRCVREAPEVKDRAEDERDILKRLAMV